MGGPSQPSLKKKCVWVHCGSCGLGSGTSFLERGWTLHQTGFGPGEGHSAGQVSVPRLCAWGLPQWMEGLPPSLGRVLSSFVSFCATEGSPEYPPFLEFWDEVLASAPAGDHRVLLVDFNAQWRWKLKGWLEGLPPRTELVCGRKVE